jgi:hypothetical protein
MPRQKKKWVQKGHEAVNKEEQIAAKKTREEKHVEEERGSVGTNM